MLDDGIYTTTSAEVLKKKRNNINKNIFLKLQSNVFEFKRTCTKFEVPFLRSRKVFPSTLYLIL